MRALNQRKFHGQNVELSDHDNLQILSAVQRKAPRFPCHHRFGTSFEAPKLRVVATFGLRLLLAFGLLAAFGRNLKQDGCSIMSWLLLEFEAQDHNWTAFIAAARLGAFSGGQLRAHMFPLVSSH